MDSSYGNAEQFVQIYNQIDDYMRKRLGHDNNDGSYASRIRFLAKRDSSFRKYLDILISYGELRNAIVHDFGRDEYRIIAEPYAEEVERYRKIKEKVMEPTLAFDEITLKADVLFSLAPEDKVSYVVSVMDKRNFNYAPVLLQGKVVGVFSPETIFSYLADQGEIKNTEEMMVKALEKYTSLSSRRLEGFLFVPKNTTVVDVEEYFGQHHPNKQRLGVIFITEHGQVDEELLGMITIWDLAKVKEQVK